MVTSRSVQRISARRPAEVKRESFEGDIEESLRMKKGLSDFKARSGNLIKNKITGGWLGVLRVFPFLVEGESFPFVYLLTSLDNLSTRATPYAKSLYIV